MIGRTRSGIQVFHTGLVNDLYMEVIGDPYLTRQTRVIIQVGFGSQYRSFRLADLAGVTLEHLDPAGRTACVAAAPMQDVYAVVFDRQNELLTGLDLKCDGAVSRFGGDLIHQKDGLL